MNWFIFKLRFRHKWDNLKIILKLKLDKLFHFRKCSCGHPLWMHQCYEHGTCIHGVCMAEPYSFFSIKCDCDNFNSMFWRK